MPSNPYGIAALWNQGDAVIKCVAVALLLMSIVSWTIIVTRTWRAARLRRASRAMAGFWHTHSFAEGMALLDEHGEANPFRHVAVEAQAAVDHHRSNGDDLHGQISLAEWLTESLRGAIDESAERMQSGLAVLASVGSTAPFVGLFGTVWGIMNSFIGIAQSQTTNLAVVAPGIAEALLATAVGLVAAIPAVVIYNFLARAITGYRQNLGDASAAIERLASRDLDVRRSLRHGAQRSERAAGSVVKIG